MGIKEILEKIKQRKARYGEAEADMRFGERLQERKKSANERELDSYLNEEREKQIAEELKFQHKQRQDEFWHGHQILKNNNNMMDNGTLLKSKNIFIGGRSIL